MGNLEQIQIEDRVYSVVYSMNFSMLETYDIICVDEYYHDIIAGPYLTYQEAVTDLKSAADRYEELRNR